MNRLAADTAIPELLRALGRWLFALARRLSRRGSGAQRLQVVGAAASGTVEPAPRIPVC